MRVRSLLCLLAIVAFARSPVGAQAVAAPHHLFVLSSTTPQMIPAVFADSVLVQGTIEGHTFWFTLDTGANGMVIDRDALRDAGIAVPPVGTEFVSDLDVGPLHASNVRFWATSYNDSDRNHRVSGIIGVSFFRSNVVSIDYDHKRLTVYPGNTFAALYPQAVPTLVDLSHGITRLHAWFGDIRATMLLDTGSDSTILFEPFAERAITGVQLTYDQGVTVGLGMPSTTEAAYRTKPMTVGGLQIRSPIVWVAQKAPVILPGQFYDGILGRDMCKTFGSITFDYANSQLYFGWPQ